MPSFLRYRRPLGFLALLLAGIAAYRMYRLNENGELWGYGPLALYLYLWAGVTLLLNKPWLPTVDRAAPQRLPSILLSTASGLLLGFGFPGYLPFPFLLLIAWVPLLLVQRRATTRQVFWHGVNTFVLYNILASYWVTNTALGPGIFAIVVNSLLMCVPWMAFHWTSHRAPRVAYLALIACWVSFEYFHYNWALNWPWLTLGNGFAQFPSLVQWYELTGALGGSAWILGVNCLVLGWWTHQLPRRVPWSLLAVALLPPVISNVRYQTYGPPPGETITVSSIQPNLEPHYSKFNISPTEEVELFLRLSQGAMGAREGVTDYLVYPETSFRQIEESTPEASPSLSALMERLPADRLRYLFTGYQGYYLFRPGEEVSDAVRYIPRNDGSRVALEALNGVLQIDLSSRDFQTYRKGVFVPGAESFPFRDVLFFLEPLVDALGGSTAGTGTQERRTPMVGEKARIAPVICYESVFGEYFTDYIREGAQAAFVVTNDGWWDNTAGHRQHLWFASLRAIETRRAVVRSANMGACAFIDQRGKIISRTYYGEQGFLNGTLQLNDAITPYVRFGDITARIALLLTAMVLLSNLAKTLRPDHSAFQP